METRRTSTSKELFSPTCLRCELSETPLWIDMPHPRFSWCLSDDISSTWEQVSCRIQVYERNGDLYWDSGQLDESRPFGITYKGQKLVSFSLYRWRVCSMNSEGTWSQWSRYACFETAMLEPYDWKAQWISTPEPHWYLEGQWESGVPNQIIDKKKSLHAKGIYLMTRTTLEYPKSRIVRARAFVVGVGTYQLYVDKRRIGRSILNPAQTDYHKRVYYDVLPLEEILASVQALNRTSIEITIFLGNGRHIALYGFDRPKGIVQILVEYENGHQQWILSNDSWSVTQGPVQENSLFNGETYDSRIEFGAMISSQAEILDGYPLKAAAIPPITVESRIIPVKISHTSQGILYDFGQNFSGFVELHTCQPKGTAITLFFAENVTENGLLNPASNRNAKAMDTFISDGKETTWHPITTYHGFRYVLVTGYIGVPSIESLRGIFIHTETNKNGNFCCSDASIQKVHEIILWSIRSNMMGIPTDSPQRDERHGWLGDAHIIAPAVLLNYESQLFYEKFLQDICDTQNSDGSITDVAPKFWMSKSADPAWGSAFVSIAWYLYWYRGDVDILYKTYPYLRRYIEFLMSQTSEGIIENLGTFGDWCAPGLITSKKTGLPYISTWYLHHDVRLMERIATRIGEDSDASSYRMHALSIRDSIISRYWTGSYMESLPMTPWDVPDQTSQVLALAGDFFDEITAEKLVGTLDNLVTDVSGNHVSSGIHGTRYLLEQLSRWGRWEKAFTIATQTSYPGWNYMIHEGATTLWERWEYLSEGSMCSHNHVMFGTIDQWYYQFVAGLSPIAAGWKEISFAPGRFKRINWAEASVSSPYGNIELSWKREHHEISIKITIPDGTIGSLFMPEENAHVESDSDRCDYISSPHPHRPYPLEKFGYWRLSSGSHTLIWIPRKS
ncbi:MAG: family 78 glycoside hydrolase catalytic domain [Sphaerochaetaceae bacterium]|nr:family 78 glycoside hydrolase catalytic domain [Sphaerochaetaceae bacterium]